MKMKVQHIVPLAKRSIAIIEDLPLTGDGKCLFPGRVSAPAHVGKHDPTRHCAVRYDMTTVRQFRSMASTYE